MEDGEANGVFVVEGDRFQMHHSVLAARSEYFRARFKSGMQDGGSKEVCYEDVSASTFRVLLWFLYAGELPAWEGVDGGGGPCGLGGALVVGARGKWAMRAKGAKRARAARGAGRPMRKRKRRRRRA